MPKKCAFVDEEGVRCGITPTYNNRGETKPLYCNTHRLDNMVFVTNTQCIYDGCLLRASFNYQGKNNRLYCSIHRLDGMVNLNCKKCIHEGCELYPTWNYEGQIKRLYCKYHHLEGMVIVSRKPCIYDGCKTLPNYNYKGERKPLYCSVHRLDGMIDIKNMKCIYDGCNIQPTYNYDTETKGIYCKSHRKDGMVNVVIKKCNTEGCKIVPSYNYDSETKGIYCRAHRLDGMIDVASKKCMYDGCKIKPTYNYEGETITIYCIAHRLDGMVDVKHKTCVNSWCKRNIYNNKYHGYCLNCFIHAHPDKPVSRNYKTKERCVVEYITSHFPDFSWVADKTITGGCSRRRPDIMLDLGYQIIIVEVDENQHINYDCSCENKRIMELSQDVDHKPIVFIRFNPDEYTDANGEDIASCWGVDGFGLCVVKKQKKKEWESRLERLREQVEYWTNPANATEKTVEIVELFYDCDS
jgi:hypothetical protein